jgi:arginyl-tRNA synthetase
MASLISLLTDIFSCAFEQAGLDRHFGHVTESQRPDLCQFQCNGALAAAKAAKKNPREVASAVLSLLQNNKNVKDLSIAGPGFINFNIDDTFLVNHLKGITQDPALGCSLYSNSNTVVIDFGGPNVAKPMHVGHLRSAIIGQALCNLFKFCGYRVISDNHLGDWGTQMGMLICAIKEMYPGLPYFDSSFSGTYPQQSPVSIDELEKIYPQANKKCKSDPLAMAEAQRATLELQSGRAGYIALWKHFVNISKNRLSADFDKLNVKFDYWQGESFYQNPMEKLVAKLREKGLAEISEGALVINVTQESDTKEVPPLLLMKSDGAFLYGTSDLATLEYRMEAFSPERIIYVVDKRQSLHFTQVFRAGRRTGIVKDTTALDHAGFGTVNGPDGKPFKTREGNAMQLGHLIGMVYEKAMERITEAGIAAQFDETEKRIIARKTGLAALKFADLQNHRESDYVFDIDKFVQFEGKTGPYLLYSAVRIKSILRNAAESGLTAYGEIISPCGDAERNLMLALCRLPDAISLASGSLLPSILCDWAYSMAQEFNRFYRDCHILKEQNKSRQASWLSLVKLSLDEVTLLLGILGIEIPERM